MPYIKTDIKWELESRYAETPGELNFKITQLLVRYLYTKGESYQTINDIMGVLECSKQEFYRRVAVPYETQKAHDNGDVFDLEVVK